MIRALSISLVLVMNACGGAPPLVEEPAMPDHEPGSFGDDLAFLRAHVPDLIVLSEDDARVAIAPSYQGRVMTSSADGDRGASFGWIHRELIASGERRPHMNAYGGEDRFWLGPEGGQYGLYFPPGAPFELEHWQVPAPIDTDAWEIVSRSDRDVTFQRDMELVNHSGARFSIRATRNVRLVVREGLPPGVRAVAYASLNAIENTGDSAWDPSTGLVSIWILSMYRPSPSTTVVIPFEPGEERGPIVNSAYFGEVPPHRLRVGESAVLFRADGRERGKIGIPRPRARRVMGSWDSERGALTIVIFTLPDEAPHGYVNSMWEEQESPYGGDVVNSYNDGPPAPGEAPLGPFYELESSSPAAALAPGERIEHEHRTIHLIGAREGLDQIAREQLGVSLDEIEAAFAE